MTKTGLVLEGGGMRGIYTAGVLDVFLDHNITVDGVIGGSYSWSIFRIQAAWKKYCI